MPSRSSYQPVYTDAAITSLLALPRRLALTAHSLAGAMATRPFDVPDSHDVDESGHALYLHVRGRVALTWWVDHAARRLVITEIRKLKT